MEKVLFLDPQDKNVFVIRDTKDFIVPQVGHYSVWSGISMLVQRVTHNYDENTLIVNLVVQKPDAPEKTEYRDLEKVAPGDEVECVYVHGASSLTFGKKYQVERIDSYRFLITNDLGVKKWYHKTNNHFKLI